MIKEGVITKICHDTMYSRSVVETIINAVLDTVTESLTNGEKVQFAGFGTFEPKQRKPRTGRNPHTNEKVSIPARVVPYFRAGKHLKDAVIKPAIASMK